MTLCHQVQQALKDTLHEFGQALDIKKTIQIQVRVLERDSERMESLAATETTKVPHEHYYYPQALYKQMHPEVVFKNPDIVIHLFANHRYWNRQLNKPKDPKEHDLRAV